MKIAPNYHVHWRDMRSKAKVDFTFEEAHFTDYRAKRQRMIPLVRVVEPTKYTLLISDEMASGGAQGLIGHRITSMSSPSLGYLLLGEIYRNPIAQPEIKSFAANLKDGVEMIFAGESDGAMVPSYIADQYSNLQPAMVSRELPGRALAAHEGVPAEVRTAVKNAMLKLHLDNNLFDVISELGTAKFVPTMLRPIRAVKASSVQLMAMRCQAIKKLQLHQLPRQSRNLKVSIGCKQKTPSMLGVF